MKKIIVTDEIKLLAERYAKELEYGTTLSTKPLENLKNLRKALQRKGTQLYMPVKLRKDNSRKKQRYQASQIPEYAEYIQFIIDTYTDINKLQPWNYPVFISKMETILKKEQLKAIVKISKQKPYTFADLIIKAMDYKGIREKVYPDYVRNEAIGIKTCVYCNAQYAITAETEAPISSAFLKKRGKSKRASIQSRSAVLRANYELDHNLPKSIYPYLCTNFYNLIPCCSSCNKHKSDRYLDFSLYARADDDLEPLYFDIPPDILLKFQIHNVCSGLHVELCDKKMVY